MNSADHRGQTDARRQAGREPESAPGGNAAWPELVEHLALCREILSILEDEANGTTALLAGSPADESEKQQLLRNWAIRLNQSVARLRVRRSEWPKGVPLPDLNAQMVRQNQELMMKILVLDRENEQARVRNGTAPLAQLARRQQPAHFVADLYRRNRVS